MAIKNNLLSGAPVDTTAQLADTQKVLVDTAVEARGQAITEAQRSDAQDVLDDITAKGKGVALTDISAYAQRLANDGFDIPDTLQQMREIIETSNQGLNSTEQTDKDWYRLFSDVQQMVANAASKTASSADEGDDAIGQPGDATEPGATGSSGDTASNPQTFISPGAAKAGQAAAAQIADAAGAVSSADEALVLAEMKKPGADAVALADKFLQQVLADPAATPVQLGEALHYEQLAFGLSPDRTDFAAHISQVAEAATAGNDANITAVVLAANNMQTRSTGSQTGGATGIAGTAPQTSPVSSSTPTDNGAISNDRAKSADATKPNEASFEYIDGMLRARTLRGKMSTDELAKKDTDVLASYAGKDAIATADAEYLAALVDPKATAQQVGEAQRNVQLAYGASTDVMVRTTSTDDFLAHMDAIGEKALAEGALAPVLNAAHSNMAGAGPIAAKTSSAGSAAAGTPTPTGGLADGTTQINGTSGPSAVEKAKSTGVVTKLNLDNPADSKILQGLMNTNGFRQYASRYLTGQFGQDGEKKAEDVIATIVDNQSKDKKGLQFYVSKSGDFMVFDPATNGGSTFDKDGKNTLRDVENGSKFGPSGYTKGLKDEVPYTLAGGFKIKVNKRDDKNDPGSITIL